MDKSMYRRHLKSQAWKALRQQVIEREGGRCQSCGCVKSRVHVHHLTYERLGSEHLDDLQLLCEDCHNILHGGSPRRARGFSSKRKPRAKSNTQDQYVKMYRPWLPEDRARMRALGLTIPREYRHLD